jgi:hypothetical protein
MAKGQGQVDGAVLTLCHLLRPGDMQDELFLSPSCEPGSSAPTQGSHSPAGKMTHVGEGATQLGAHF